MKTLEEMLSESTITNDPRVVGETGRTLRLPDFESSGVVEAANAPSPRGATRMRGTTFMDFNRMSSREQQELMRNDPQAVFDAVASAQAVSQGRSPTEPVSRRNLADLQLAEQLAQFVPDEASLEGLFLQMTGRQLPSRGLRFSYMGRTPQMAFEKEKLVAVENARQAGEMRRKRLDMLEWDPTTGQMKMKAPERTEGERRDAGYTQRMAAAEDLMADHESGQLPSRAEYYSRKYLPWIGADVARTQMDLPRQLYRQAQEDWVRAKLRRESGAVIGEQEMENEIQTYFPQPGEGPEVAEQKRQARIQAMRAMRLGAGRANTDVPYSRTELIEEARKRGMLR